MRCDSIRSTGRKATARDKTRASNRPTFPKLLVVAAAILALSALFVGAQASRGDAAATVTAQLVKDINPTGGSSPSYLAVLGGSLYFQAADSIHGTELWKSDGTAAGTAMVKDINPTGDGFPYYMAAFNGSLYLRANDGVHGYELWKSDGTAAGTTMAVDINPTGGSDPGFLTVFNSDLYFGADDGSHGNELWRYGDFSPPETTITSGPSGPTSASSPAFAFSADEPGSFECSLDGGAYSACSSPKTVGPLADGAHTFRVRAIDTSGNVDASPAERAFTIDTTAPDTQIASGPSGLVKKKSASFSFSSTEASAVFECSLDGAGWTACVSPRTYTGLSDGRHTFNVRAVDQAGNVDATPSSSAFTIDTRAPQTKIIKHPKKLVRTMKAKVKAPFTFRSSETGSRFSCKLDKGKWKSCRSPKAYKVKLGKHTFQVRATDKTGNTDRSPAKWVWKVKRG
jgi:ELWxxDGT repeat protein